MKFFVGVTDREWFRTLHARSFDEVNFWKPKAQATWHPIDVGSPFLFKLREAPHVIAGGGFFVRYTVVPTSLAWEAFGEKNGRHSFDELRSVINRLGNTDARDPHIGCIVLAAPFFFDPEDYIPYEGDRFVGPGKTLDTASIEGAHLWQQVNERLNYLNWIDDSEHARYREAEVLQRVGQGGFRLIVTDAYRRRCAISGERTLPVLEAAHIIPYKEEGKHLVTNGLLLRSDLHKLFDKGYITVTPDYHVEVSRRIREEFENGRDYYRLHGNILLSLPDIESQRPARDALVWHNENRFAA